MGPSQRHERDAARLSTRHVVARAQVQVVGVGEDHLRAPARRSLGSSAFTVASVPTGMKHGVSTSPCGVAKRRRVQRRMSLRH